MLDVTPLLRVYGRRRLARLHAEQPAATQERQLLRLVRSAAATRFGRDHGFDGIRGVGDFRARVPLRAYDAFWREYWQPAFPRLADTSWPGVIPFFALTSGTTTGKTKYIPVSRPMIRANIRAGADLFVHHLANRPASRFLGGRNFMLGGSTDLVELAPGIWSGDLSGIAARAMPGWARLRYFPPRHLETIADWEEKIAALAALAHRYDIRSISGTPSWLLLFFERLAASAPGAAGGLAAVWPNLELLVHGGVAFPPYRPLFDRWLAGSRAETREIYAASEGVIAVADRGDGEGLRLILDNGLFYEFVPVDELAAAAPRRHWIADAEPGINYALVVSSCAGLWAYVIGDTVRLVDRSPPRILITGRVSYSLSAFGEHLIAEEIETAVAAAAAGIGLGVSDFAVGAVFPRREGERGGHLFVVEFGGAVPDAAAVAAFAAAVDRRLADLNADYRAHRAGGYGMRPPVVLVAAAGSFAAWMKSRGQLGGQHKVPRIINDPALFEALRAFVAGRRD